MERTRDMRNDSKAGFLIKLQILLFFRSYYIANGQGVGEGVRKAWSAGIQVWKVSD